MAAGSLSNRMSALGSRQEVFWGRVVSPSEGDPGEWPRDPLGKGRGTVEFRQNVATREWVLFAPERARRPDDHGHPSVPPERAAHPSLSKDCPFCPGNEVRTPGETMRLSDAEGLWYARSFPNGFPAVYPDGEPTRSGDRFHRSMGAVGQHEVVVESRLHNTTLALMTVREVSDVVAIWKSRVACLRSLPQTELVMLFKNHGLQAGSSLDHPHSQIVSLPVTPWQVRHRMEDALRYYDDAGECVFCRMLDVEREDGDRLVESSDWFTAFVPYAAYSPYSVWIMPHRHSSCLSQSSEDEAHDFARVLQTVLGRIYHGLGDPSYNLVMRLANRDSLGDKFVHWYASVVPRLGRAAGFELGTGMFINTSLPENDAQVLRWLELPKVGDT